MPRASRQSSAAYPKTSADRRKYFAFLSFAALLASGLVAFWFCPRFVYWRGLDNPFAWGEPEVERAYFTIKQIADPFAPVINPSNWVIAWRLLLPLIWHYLHLPIWLFLILPQLGCIAALALTIHILYRYCSDRPPIFWTAVALGACPWFFTSFGWLTYFDSWIVVGLLIATFQSRAATIIATLFLPWIDERFLMVLPLCLVMRAINPATGHLRPRREISRDIVFVLLACMPYPILRLLLSWSGHGGHAMSYASNYASTSRLAAISFTTYLNGIWISLRAAWFFLGVLFWLLWKLNHKKLAAALMLLMLLLIAVAFVVAQDIGRSISMITAPMAALGAVLLSSQKPQLFRAAAPIVAIANLLLPASHVNSYKTYPIRYFYVELDEWQHPPDIFNPKTWLAVADQLQKQNKLQEVPKYYDLAVQLSPDDSTALVARADYEFKLGQLDKTEADLQKATQINPNDPEIYLTFAGLRLHQGDARGAIAQLQTALSVAPPTWPNRQRAQDLLTKLSPAP